MAYDHTWQSLLRPGNSEDFFRDHRSIEFRVQAEGFNPVNAWWLAELSRLIYRRDATEGFHHPGRASRNEILATVGLIERHFINGPTVQGSLVTTAEDGEDAYAALVFRGTVGRLASWLGNLDMAMTPSPRGGRVHRGFNTMLMELWDEISEALDAVRVPLFYTGHSLGGALATLAASLRPPQAVYTFGTPRIGDAVFAETLAGMPIYHVCNPGDIVTGLPPARWGSGFTLPGTRIINTDVPLSHRSISQAPAFLAGHAPLNYTAQLPVAFEN